MSLTEHLLRPLLSSAARPIITHYDDAEGTRVELSVTTLANWAAKTANWLVEEHDVEPGDDVAVDLPSHWQTAGVLLGAWWCGANVTANAAGARVAFVGPEAGGADGADAMAVVALDAMGMGLREPGTLAEGALDYLTEARLAGDDFSPLLPIPGDTPALLGTSVDEVLAHARARASELEIGDGDRVLSTTAWTLPDGVLDGLLAPLAARASIVQVSHPIHGKLPAHRGNERATVDLV